MAHFTLQVDSPRTVADAWARLVDWKEHGAVAPLTKVAVTGGPARVDSDVPTVGEEFIARSGIGPLSFDDVMRVTAVEASLPSRRIEIEKVGRLLKGTVCIDFVPADKGGTSVVWTQDFQVALLPKFLNRLIGPVLSMAVAPGYRSAVKKLVG